MAATTLSKTRILRQVRQDWAGLAVGKTPPYMLVSLAGLFVCSLVLYFHTVLVESHANQKQQEIIQIKQENDKLQAMLAELKTLPRIEQKARELGMETVRDFHYITMSTALATQVSAPAAQPAQEQISLHIPAGF